MNRYDCTVIVTAYNAEKSIEKCIRSIFSQKVNDYQVLILVGYDNSEDETFSKLVSLGKESPSWAEYRILVNTRNNIFIDGQRTGRANFLNCYNRAKGKALMFCDGDDYWVDENKLCRQTEIVLNDGKASYMYSAEIKPPRFYSPFLQGNQVVFSSLCIPADLFIGDLADKIRLLDWYVVCMAFQEVGLIRVDGYVEYSSGEGSWTSLAHRVRSRSTVSSANIMFAGGRLRLLSRLALRLYMWRLNMVIGRKKLD